MLFGWWLNLWDLLGSRLQDSFDLLVDFCPIRALNPLPNSFKWIPEICPILGMGLCICFYQVLDENSHRTIMLNFCVYVQKSILSNVRNWCFPMWCISSSAEYPLDIPLSLLHFCACISCTEDKFWEERFFVQLVFLTLHGVLPVCRIWFLHGTHLTSNHLPKIIPKDCLVPSHSGFLAYP